MAESRNCRRRAYCGRPGGLLCLSSSCGLRSQARALKSSSRSSGSGASGAARSSACWSCAPVKGRLGPGDHAGSTSPHGRQHAGIQTIPGSWRHRSEWRSWRPCTIARNRAPELARWPGSRGRNGPGPAEFLALALPVGYRFADSRSSRSAAGSPKPPRLPGPSWLPPWAGRRGRGCVCSCGRAPSAHPEWASTRHRSLMKRIG